MINRIALAGCGNVGTALLELLHEKKDELARKYNFHFEVTMITDLFKGTVADPDGLDLKEVLNQLHTCNSLKAIGEKEGSFEEVLLYSNATMLAEATPTNLETGEPGLTFIRTALKNGISATMTNKGPVAVAMEELLNLATENNAQLKYEGVIMSGTPLVNLIQTGLAGCKVLKAEGILNGTTNFMLTQMSHGESFDEALKDAQDRGYAETDPSGDVEGWDCAVKVSILSQILYGEKIDVKDVDRTGITDVTKEEVVQAKLDGTPVKLISSIEHTEEGKLIAKVQPIKVRNTHPLASINGATNAITLTTDNLGDITLTGPGAGRRETGQALLTDLIEMGI